MDAREAGRGDCHLKAICVCCEMFDRGGGAAEIAASLELSIHTIRRHIRGIYWTLHVHSRGEAGTK